ncbi:MAG: ABC transporter substrate-binding protein [Flavisolibacter sp.]
MPSFIDQLGRSVHLAKTPQRIVSLVPSQTELLFDLGLEDEVVGLTKFCIHPQPWMRTKTIVGGTKQISIEKIKHLQPDLIIANKEENIQDQVEELAKQFPVWVSDVSNLNDALEMINSVGSIVNKELQAQNIVDKVRVCFHKLQTTNFKLQTAYLIWKQPYMTVGGDTFINDMMSLCGFNNIFADRTRYPVVSKEDLNNCELLLLSSEPYPFKEKDITELQQILPNTKIMIVDGEMFSWYGSRLLKAPSYFKQLQNQVLSLRHARGTE